MVVIKTAMKGEAGRAFRPDQFDPSSDLSNLFSTQQRQNQSIFEALLAGLLVRKDLDQNWK